MKRKMPSRPVSRRPRGALASMTSMVKGMAPKMMISVRKPGSKSKTLKRK